MRIWKITWMSHRNLISLLHILYPSSYQVLDGKIPICFSVLIYTRYLGSAWSLSIHQKITETDTSNLQNRKKKKLNFTGIDKMVNMERIALLVEWNIWRMNICVYIDKWWIMKLMITLAVRRHVWYYKDLSILMRNRQDLKGGLEISPPQIMTFKHLVSCHLSVALPLVVSGPYIWS